jgi:putative helix-turn-helix protein (fragment)
MSRTNDQSTELPHHEPTDSDIAEAMRDRRVELGLTVEESAERAGVSTQTWRNYEHGRTTVRGDKQHGVWDVLGWEQPGRWAPLSALERVVEPAGGPLDDDVMESFRNLWGDEPADGATKTLGPPAWDSVPDVLGAYSPLLATTLGEGAARCYALGADLYGRLLEEDLGALAAMPRDAHIGQLDVSHMREMLPSLWLTRYDYEFLFQLKEIGAVTTHRLVGAEPAPDEPLVRSFAEAIVVHDAFALGGVVASSLGVDLAERDWEGWVNALSGPAEPAHRLTSTVLIPSADEMIHIDHWFDPLTDPFVPAWRSVDDVPSAGGPEAGATVTALHHED